MRKSKRYRLAIIASIVAVGLFVFLVLKTDHEPSAIGAGLMMVMTPVYAAIAGDSYRAHVPPKE